ncbi:unnamed protein product [Amoebophrya sp. A120]|nr:unnamed protein product [Amoebophrya sp. A120]|eukprot:GSA120T00019004001.1
MRHVARPAQSQSLPHYVYRGVQARGIPGNAHALHDEAQLPLSAAAEAALSPQNKRVSIHRLRKAIVESLVFLRRPEPLSRKWTAYAIRALGREKTTSQTESILALLQMQLSNAGASFHCFSAALNALPLQDATRVFDLEIRCRLPVPRSASSSTPDAAPSSLPAENNFFGDTATNAPDETTSISAEIISVTTHNQELCPEHASGIVVTYGALIQKCVQGKEAKLALRYFHEFRSRYSTCREVRPSSQLYTSVAKALDLVDDAPGVLRLFEDAVTQSAVDLVLANAVLSAVVRQPGHEESATRIFARMKHELSLDPSVVTLNTMLRLFARQRDSKGALQLLRAEGYKLRRREEQLFDQVTLSTLIQCFAPSQWKHAVRIALKSDWSFLDQENSDNEAEFDDKLHLPDHDGQHEPHGPRNTLLQNPDVDKTHELTSSPPCLLFSGKNADVGHKGNTGSTAAWGFTHLFSLLHDAATMSQVRSREAGVSVYPTKAEPYLAAITGEDDAGEVEDGTTEEACNDLQLRELRRVTRYLASRLADHAEIVDHVLLSKLLELLDAVGDVETAVAWYRTFQDLKARLQTRRQDEPVVKATEDEANRESCKAPQHQREFMTPTPDGAGPGTSSGGGPGYYEFVVSRTKRDGVRTTQVLDLHHHNCAEARIAIVAEIARQVGRRQKNSTQSKQITATRESAEDFSDKDRNRCEEQDSAPLTTSSAATRPSSPFTSQGKSGENEEIENERKVFLLLQVGQGLHSKVPGERLLAPAVQHFVNLLGFRSELRAFGDTSHMLVQGVLKMKRRNVENEK